MMASPLSAGARRFVTRAIMSAHVPAHLSLCTRGSAIESSEDMPSEPSMPMLISSSVGDEPRMRSVEGVSVGIGELERVAVCGGHRRRGESQGEMIIKQSSTYSRAFPFRKPWPSARGRGRIWHGRSCQLFLFACISFRAKLIYASRAATYRLFFRS